MQIKLKIYKSKPRAAKCKKWVTIMEMQFKTIPWQDAFEPSSKTKANKTVVSELFQNPTLTDMW
jgi:hypothetical protein